MKRFYFMTISKGKCGCAGHTCWKYTDRYTTKKDVAKRFGLTAKIVVLTEEQFSERFGKDAKALCWD